MLIYKQVTIDWSLQGWSSMTTTSKSMSRCHAVFIASNISVNNLLKSNDYTITNLQQISTYTVHVNTLMTA